MELASLTPVLMSSQVTAGVRALESSGRTCGRGEGTFLLMVTWGGKLKSELNQFEGQRITRLRL